MAINIPQNRINQSSVNTKSGAIAKAGQRQSALPDNTGNAYTVPKRADVNYIPGPESLSTLIRSAVAALRQGIYWDRGTLLNLVV